MSAVDRLDHVLSADQFDRERIDAILARAAELSDVRDNRFAAKILATLFYEPSTRTRLSFASAMLRGGGSVLGTEAATASSSAAKGESLEDTIRVVSGYADVIVLRHPQEGAAHRAAAVADVPIINAGDGGGEHPTQALLDLFCMQRDHGRIDGLNIAICGDLKHGRTVHSLVRLLAAFANVRLTFVAPDIVQAPSELVAVAVAGGLSWTKADSLDSCAAEVDVIYQTRVQKERFASMDDFAAAQGVRIDAALLGRLPKHTTIMHPLPRVDEIDVAVDADQRAAYFRQAIGGVAVRMAVLEMLLG